MPRAWIETPDDWGWGQVQLLKGTLYRLGYYVSEWRGVKGVRLELTGSKRGEEWRVPPGLCAAVREAAVLAHNFARGAHNREGCPVDHGRGHAVRGTDLPLLVAAG